MGQDEIVEVFQFIVIAFWSLSVSGDFEKYKNETNGILKIKLMFFEEAFRFSWEFESCC